MRTSSHADDNLFNLVEICSRFRRVVAARLLMSCMVVAPGQRDVQHQAGAGTKASRQYVHDLGATVSARAAPPQAVIFNATAVMSSFGGVSPRKSCTPSKIASTI